MCETIAARLERANTHVEEAGGAFRGFKDRELRAADAAMVVPEETALPNGETLLRR